MCQHHCGTGHTRPRRRENGHALAEPCVYSPFKSPFRVHSRASPVHVRALHNAVSPGSLVLSEGAGA